MDALIVGPDEARSMLKMSRHRVFELLESGDIPAYREGNEWKIPRRLLESYVIARAEEETQIRRIGNEHESI